MKQSAFGSLSKLVTVGLCLLIFAACSSSSSVPLTGPAPAPGKPGEEGGDARPTPTPTPDGSPTPTPSPTPVPVAQVAARIYCSPGTQISQVTNLSSLHGDSVENYKGTILNFTLKNGTDVTNLKFPISLKSDRRQGTLLISAMTADAPDVWKLYKGNVNFLQGSGVLELLSSNTSKPNEIPYIDQNLNIPMKFVDANASRTAFVYPNDRGNYVLQTEHGSKTALPFDADHYANPKFIRDTWIAFDQHISDYKIAQKFYSVKSGKTTSVSSASDSRDYQLFGFVSSQGTFFWAEGRPGNGWKIKASRGTTVATLRGSVSDIRLPIVFFESRSQVYAAYIEEKIEKNSKGTFETKIGHLNILKISSSLKVSETKTVEYSDRIKNMVVPGVSSPEILRYLFFEPVSGQLFASIVSKGGLASYDIQTNSWSIHATSDMCNYPSWGIEETYE